MPTRYVRMRTNYVVSAATDYSRPTIDTEFEEEFTPDEVSQIEVDVPTGGVTIDLGIIDTISDIIVYNADTSNYVRAQWYNQRGTSTYATTELAFNEANPDTITKTGGDDFNSTALDMQIGGYVRVTNSTSDDGTYLAQNVEAATITLGNQEDLVGGGADSATPTLDALERNSMRIDAGQTIKLGPVDSALDLTLTANTATCSCTVFILGT